MFGKNKEGGKCGKEFTSKVYLRQHYQLVHQKMMHRCDRCPKEFSGRKYLMAHMSQKHNSLEPHKCKDCEKICLGERDLQFHVKRVHSVGMTEADVSKQFKNLMEKVEHNRNDWEAAKIVWECGSAAKIVAERKTGRPGRVTIINSMLQWLGKNREYKKV